MGAGNPTQHFRDLLKQSQVIRAPRRRLATFGDTEIDYQLVTAVSSQPAKSNVRAGRVKATRPRILTPDAFAQRFDGFGDDASSFERFLKDRFTESFRALEYNFQNILESTTPHHQDARELAENIRKDLDARDLPRSAVLLGPESGWGFALMKFLLDETSQSFAANVRELDERGLFDADPVSARRHREIDALFLRAERDPALIKPLADKLKNYGLFNEFQDRFFSLVNRSAA